MRQATKMIQFVRRQPLWAKLLAAALVVVGIVTRLFAALERGQVRLKFLDRWSPHRGELALGALRPAQGSRAEAALGLAIR